MPPKMELEHKAQALINVLSDDIDDYPDARIYRMVKDREKDLQKEINKSAKMRRKIAKKADEAKDLLQKREAKAEENWENADLIFPYGDEDDIHFEADGWETDGKHYSRVYYVSVNGEESEKHSYSIEFKDGTDEIECCSEE